MIENMKRNKEERLILRLPSDESQAILWLFISSDNYLYGSLAAGGNDPELTLLLANYPALVLVPASEFTFHQVNLPSHVRNRPLQVLPFILEEQLATEVESLHFAILQQSEDVCEVAVVEKNIMQHWLACCDSLGAKVERLLPDVLMLPLASEGWSAVCLNDQWLFRRGAYAGMVAESSWLPELLAESPPTVIESYSLPPADVMGIVEWRMQPECDLMQLVAYGDIYRGADLLQGTFSRGNYWHIGLRRCRSVIWALLIYLLLLCTQVGERYYHLWQQAEYWRLETVRLYQQLFPTEKNVINPYMQMQQHLQHLQSTKQSRFSEQIYQLEQLLAGDETTRVQALSYNHSLKELQVDFQVDTLQTQAQILSRASKFYRVISKEVKQSLDGLKVRLTLGIIEHE
ncbi:type II secretion system protein GspL [Yersinia enterocolitica]|uniref:type II secretion system protein GspL n=1 Tax=Yersinia enterocolitica TaxID=630 RepID=UPI003AB77C97